MVIVVANDCVDVVVLVAVVACLEKVDLPFAESHVAAVVADVDTTESIVAVVALPYGITIDSMVEHFVPVMTYHRHHPIDSS